MYCLPYILSAVAYADTHWRSPMHSHKAAVLIDEQGPTFVVCSYCHVIHHFISLCLQLLTLCIFPI